MHHHRVALGDLVDDEERPATGVEVVLGEDLEETDLRLFRQDVGVVGGSQPDAEAEIGQVPSVRQSSSFSLNQPVSRRLEAVRAPALFRGPH